ncbi:hypothetical protein [Caballeronia novacaledonica]|uniref:Uncharacterized protein n=1 Tax=Caballeronia novacaledonica TaxID=1544861 RepID=A0AA37IGN1_9BURK|nr:hypothetical protein [Caballeronia novacaledonica]GJH29410.1 hypothetical protein CBA19CS42_32860 [Caballeronia novacaledonica]
MNAKTLSDAEAFYGTAKSQPTYESYEVGRWSLDVVEGALRNIRFNDKEIIRAVSFLVRDEDWSTCRPSIHDAQIEQLESSFHFTYSAECANPRAQALSYEVSIDCEATGDLTFRATWRTKADFLTARTGFCVLHPIEEVAGAHARVTHSDGSVEHSQFPMLIDPWQPFKDIRSIEHKLPCGLSVRCTLLGDTFEMEDQRNWSDASFKTYSRPLDLPWPYLMEAGATNEQVVQIRVTGEATARSTKSTTSDSGSAVRIDVDISDELFPKLGLAIAPEEVSATLDNMSQLVELAPQRLTLCFDPVAGHGRDELAGFATLQRGSGIPAILECVVPGISDPGDELSCVAAMGAEAGLTLAGIFVTPSVHRLSDPPGSVSRPCPPVDELYRAARRLFPALSLGGGVFSYFTELNRKRPPLNLVDWVAHATCPIVHAADDLSVMETLEAVSHITRSCRALIGAKPYSIGPVSIGMRQNPYGSRPMSNLDQERITMADEDPRDRALFGAAWLTGYVAALSGSSIDCITLGGFTGPRGVLGSAGDRYPNFAIAKHIANFAGMRRLICKSSHAKRVTAFGAVGPSGDANIIVANLTELPQSAYLLGQKKISLRPFECRELVIPARDAAY